jgi:hypothetical protein
VKNEDMTLIGEAIYLIRIREVESYIFFNFFCKIVSLFEVIL